MRNIQKKSIRRALCALGMVLGATTGAHVQAQGIPTIDIQNVVQSTISALQNVMAVQKQIEQYQTQLQQYENMLVNSANPSAFNWDAVQSTITKLNQASNTLKPLTAQAGGIDAFLQQTKDFAGYSTSACFTSAGCSTNERAALASANAAGSQSQKAANDDAMRTIALQQQSLQNDAMNLQMIQSQASGAQGQMQAIQAANQFASAQGNQLLQIRTLLLAAQNAVAARDRVVADREAQQSAAGQQLRQGSFRASSSRTW